jgi:hypothetical protein
MFTFYLLFTIATYFIFLEWVDEQAGEGMPVTAGPVIACLLAIVWPFWISVAGALAAIRILRKD